jgi:hypothetical protein
MGTGKLNIWISEIQQPCKMSQHNWWITIFDCSGEVLEWPKNHKYLYIPAPASHLEVELPPGTYRIMATGPIWFDRQALGHLLARYNLFTDSSIVHINCGKDTCVTLYPPSYHRCGSFLVEATKVLLNNKVIPREAANNLIEAIHKVKEYLPKPTQIDETEEFLDELIARIAEQEKEIKAK